MTKKDVVKLINLLTKEVGLSEHDAIVLIARAIIHKENE